MLRLPRLGLVLVCLALFGCARSANSPQPHVLRIAFAGDPNSLVPLLAIDQDVVGLDGFFCQTLIGLNADNRDVPILVTRVPSRQNGDISRDGTRITYHLRPDARFASKTCARRLNSCCSTTLGRSTGRPDSKTRTSRSWPTSTSRSLAST